MGAIHRKEKAKAIHRKAAALHHPHRHHTRRCVVEIHRKEKEKAKAIHRKAAALHHLQVLAIHQKEKAKAIHRKAAALHHRRVLAIHQKEKAKAKVLLLYSSTTKSVNTSSTNLQQVTSFSSSP